VNNRVLGTIAMICAPAMLVEGLIPGGDDMPIVVGIASMIFMGGAFASLLGLWRVAATGTSWWGRGVLALQLTLVSLAFCFGFFEATGLLSDEDLLFTITDIAWPISMLTMNLVGVTAAVVGRLPGWQRFALLPCGLAFPATMVLSILSGSDTQSDWIGIVFFALLAIFWALMGFVVRQSAAPLAPSAVPSSRTAAT
jgi:hypothetical protein